MMGIKKIKSFKKLAEKVKGLAGNDSLDPSHEKFLRQGGGDGSPRAVASSKPPPPGFFVLYVGEERQRFVVPTGYLAHPLFRMLLEKAYEEYGIEHVKGLVVPCTVPTFEEVVSAVECCHGNFDIARLMEEFVMIES